MRRRSFARIFFESPAIQILTAVVFTGRIGFYVPLTFKNFMRFLNHGIPLSFHCRSIDTVRDLIFLVTVPTDRSKYLQRNYFFNFLRSREFEMQWGTQITQDLLLPKIRSPRELKKFRNLSFLRSKCMRKQKAMFWHGLNWCKVNFVVVGQCARPNKSSESLWLQNLLMELSFKQHMNSNSC